MRVCVCEYASFLTQYCSNRYFQKYILDVFFFSKGEIPVSFTLRWFVGTLGVPWTHVCPSDLYGFCICGFYSKAFFFPVHLDTIDLPFLWLLASVSVIVNT